MAQPGPDTSAGRLSRRGVLAGAGLFVGGVAVTAGTRRVMEPESKDVQGLNPRSDAWYDLRLSGDGLMDNQLLWFLGHATHGQSDVGDVLETARRIQPGDEKSWFESWLKTATRVHQHATAAEAKGHRVSAGQAYARAANYYRAATMHYTNREDPALMETTRAAASTFEKSNALLGFDIQPVDIPYEGTNLPAYFVRSPYAQASAPVILLHQGLHAWPEETKWVWEGARRRGYHVLFFHGPGQGRALREKNLSFRPDWEKAVSPVVDAAERISGVDPKRILLMGLSFGGALAPRAAAFEQRLALCIANPGVLSWWEQHTEHFNRFLPGALSLLKSHPEAFDEAIHGLAKRWPTADYWLKDVYWKHGARSPSELFRKLEEFTNEAIVERIRCPVLIMDGEAEDVSPGQSQKLYDALRGPKHLMTFTQAEAAPLHCQSASAALAEERLFDWLDENV
ncbi:alpha/beta hydrolase family protein [Myxococcus stipitatus]|uniref:alpha/beta hydrolase family protein n=1 Tax=Myxococcus stipitatus TaxID=83455 RepID=UPI0030CC8489